MPPLHNGQHAFWFFFVVVNIYLFLFHIYEYFDYIYACAPYAHGDQKRVSDQLKLELGTVCKQSGEYWELKQDPVQE